MYKARILHSLSQCWGKRPPLHLTGRLLSAVIERFFVVNGHDPNARNQLEAMLRCWGLEPLVLGQLPTEGQTVIEKLELAMAEADFGVVLATPAHIA